MTAERGFRRRLSFALLLLLAEGLLAVIGYRVLGGPDVTVLQAVYMAVITVTGVGYTEVVDTSHNPTLRLFNIFVVVIGVGIALYVFSVLTAFIVEGELRHLFRRSRMRNKINQLRHHYIVCGLGETGRYAVEELHKTGTHFVVVEVSQEVVERVREHPGGSYSEMLYIIGDATDESVLKEAGLEHARGIIACLAADKDNLVIIVLVRQQNPKIRIVARYKELSFSERMVKAGANATVSPNRIGGLRMASEVVRPHVVSFLDLMLQEKSRTLRIEEIEVGEGSSWTGMSLPKLQLRTKFDLTLLALKWPDAAGPRLQLNPPDDTVVTPGMIIIVMGDVTNLRRARADAGAVAA